MCREADDSVLRLLPLKHSLSQSSCDSMVMDTSAADDGLSLDSDTSENFVILPDLGMTSPPCAITLAALLTSPRLVILVTLVCVSFFLFLSLLLHALVCFFFLLVSLSAFIFVSLTACLCMSVYLWFPSFSFCLTACLTVTLHVSFCLSVSIPETTRPNGTPIHSVRTDGGSSADLSSSLSRSNEDMSQDMVRCKQLPVL